MSLPRVSAVGVGADPVTGAPVIVVFVTGTVPRDPQTGEESIPAELESVPVQIMETEAIVAQDEHDG